MKTVKLPWELESAGARGREKVLGHSREIGTGASAALVVGWAGEETVQCGGSAPLVRADGARRQEQRLVGASVTLEFISDEDPRDVAQVLSNLRKKHWAARLSRRDWTGMPKTKKSWPNFRHHWRTACQYPSTALIHKTGIKDYELHLRPPPRPKWEADAGTLGVVSGGQHGT